MEADFKIFKPSSVSTSESLIQIMKSQTPKGKSIGHPGGYLECGSAQPSLFMNKFEELFYLQFDKTER